MRSLKSSTPAAWMAIAAVEAALGTYLLLSGHHLDLFSITVLGLLPIVAYFLIQLPFVFPYGLYAFLIPFGSLLNVANLGTVGRLLGALSGGVLIFYALRKKRFVNPPFALALWALYILWGAAALMWSVDPGQSFVGVGQLLQLFLLYAIVAVAPTTRSDLRAVLGAAILGGVVAGAYGAWMFYHQSNSAVAQVQTQLNRVLLESGGNYVDPNQFADSLLLPAIALTCLFLRETRRFLKIAWVWAFTFVLAGIFFSGSREALVAYLVALVFIGAVSQYRRQILIIGGWALAASALMPMIWLRFGLAINTGGAGRISIWHTGLKAAAPYWWFGDGLNNFVKAYDAVYLNVFQPYGAGWSRAPHNIIIQNLVELGIVGVILLVVALVAQYRMLSYIKPTDSLYDYRVMLQATLVALIVASLFIDLLLYKYIWLLFALMAQVRAVRLAERGGCEVAIPAVPIVATRPLLALR